MHKILFSAVAAATLSACSGIESRDWTSSGFVTAGAGGITHSLSNLNSGSSSGTVGTVHYLSGTDNGAQALAALGTDVNTGAPISETFYYYGPWGVRGIRNITVTETSSTTGFLSGENFSDNGDIALVADYGAGTIEGSAIGSFGTLTVNGTFSGTDIGGTATYDGKTASLDGLLGTQGAVGIFQGNADDWVMAGGFAADLD